MPEAESVRALRRSQIVVAARRIVAAQGLEALTFAALEQELSFTRGVVTWHFRNKDDILAAVLEDAIADIDARALGAIRAERGLEDRARAVVREMVHGWLGGSDAGPVLVSFWGRLRVDAPAAERNEALFARYRGYAAALVRTGQERGEFVSSMDPESMGALMVALVLGIALQALFASVPGRPIPIEVDRVIDAAGDAVVAVLRPTPREAR